MTNDVNRRVAEVTERIRLQSDETRGAYLERLDQMADRPRVLRRKGCAPNKAHAVAAVPKARQLPLLTQDVPMPNLYVVTAYNELLSAHSPYGEYPEMLRGFAAAMGANLQVAGGTPAMCDGVTQGLPGMELSLLSRDEIARSAAIALSHDTGDGSLMLGICDKIVPGLLIGALHFGHMPAVFVPAGPMGSGISNAEKAKVRMAHRAGQIGDDDLQVSELKAYHGEGTCTFYGTANSNQMLLEAMGLHVPGAAFIHPRSPLRRELNREAVRTLLDIRSGGKRFTPIGRLVDERCIVNAMVALLATGGSTNHLIHWVAVARSAGIRITPRDFADLSETVPLLARVYPNGQADVNRFQAMGGPSWIIRELLAGGYMHPDVTTVAEEGISAYARVPELAEDGTTVQWPDLPAESGDDTVVRTVDRPFSPNGGLKLLTGNLGNSAFIKVSAVPADRLIIEAPAAVFSSQEEVQQAYDAGELNRDVVVVVRFQGPRANGMPELHKLSDPLGNLQNGYTDRHGTVHDGFRVALVTDGRMSGASGKVPAAIHVSHEALAGGPLAKVRNGDIIRLDAEAGTLNVLVDDDELDHRPAATISLAHAEDNGLGFGRELFRVVRENALPAEEGACTW